MKINRIAAGLLFVVLLLLVAVSLFVSIVPIEFTVSAHGRVEPSRVLRVAFPAGGRIVLLARGPVRKGRLIAALDTSAAKSALASLARRAGLLRKEMDLERKALAAGGRELGLRIAQADQDLKHLEETLSVEKGKLADVSLQIVKLQQEEKALTAVLRRSEEAVLSSLISQGLVTKMEMALSKHRSDLARLEAAQIKLQVDREKLARQLRVGDLAARKTGKESELSILKIRPQGGRGLLGLERQLEEIKAQAERVSQTIADKRILAPFDGQILITLASVGEVASAGQNLLLLADESSLVFRATCGQSLRSDLAVRQKAKVRIENYPHLAFGYVPAALDEIQTRISHTEAPAYVLRFSLGKPPFRIVTGLAGTADVTIFRGTVARYLARNLQSRKGGKL